MYLHREAARLRMKDDDWTCQIGVDIKSMKENHLIMSLHLSLPLSLSLSLLCSCCVSLHTCALCHLFSLLFFCSINQQWVCCHGSQAVVG